MSILRKETKKIRSGVRILNFIRELYTYRAMIDSMVKKELRGKYAASFLGFLWTFVNPLLQLIVYTIVFSFIFQNSIEKFYLFLFIGLVPWLFFSSVLSEGSNCIVAQKNLVKKIYFPRMVIPISFAASRFINMLLTFLVIFAVIFFTGWGVNWVALLYLPLVFLIEFLLVIGIALIVSSLTVYFRDLSYILGIISLLWMYATPVFYSPTYVPEKFLKIYNLNPMVSIISAFRDILYYKRLPLLSTLVEAVILGCVFFLIGIFLFSKLNKNFAEEL